MSKNLTCLRCEQKMDHVGTEKLQLGKTGWIFGDWSNLLAGAMGVDIYEGEVPVFWPCGVTPQAAVENAKPPIVITHSPGHMFITDIENAKLNDYLEEQKNKS